MQRYCGGIFLVSLATLLFETSLIRVFSVTLFSPFAFMIVSSALFGSGLGGVYLSLFPSMTERTGLDRRLSRLSLAFAVSILLSLVAILKVPFRITYVTSDPGELAILLLHDAVLIVPFFFAGMVIALLLSALPGRINTLYFFDLIGAGLGALLVLPLLPLLGGPGLIVLTAGLAAASAFCFGSHGWKAAAAVSVTGLALVTALVRNAGWLEVQAYENKHEFTHDLNANKIIYSEWNALSRIDVSEQADKNRRKIFVDGGTYVTVMLPFDGDFAKVHAMDRKSWFLPYLLRDQADALIIGSGGGREVMVALGNGARSITAVELDPIIADVVKNEFDDYLGGLFNDPRVQLVNDEGRSFVQRTQQKFDVIQQVNNNSPVAMASGALNLSETHLLTVEAFHDYLDHLSDDGILAINRAGSVRLAALARQTFDERGVQDSARRVVVLEGDETADDELFLLKGSPFDADELARVQRFADEEGLDVRYTPEVRDQTNLYRQILTSSDPQQLYDDAALNLAPPTDDQPFFNHMRKWSELGVEPDELPRELRHLVHSKTAHLPFDGGDLVLLVLLAEALVLSGLFVFLPLSLFKRRGLQGDGKLKILGYFAALGLGFILVEISLMQRFVLFLGNPMYAITTILVTLLSSAGIGSYLSNRFGLEPQRHLVRILTALGAVLVAYLFLLQPVCEHFLDEPFAARLAIAVALLAPLGVLMGMPFPLGIRIVERTAPQLVPWAWGVNGYTTVVGSVLSVILAMTFGFNAVLLLAAAVYLGGLLLIVQLRPAGATVAVAMPVPTA